MNTNIKIIPYKNEIIPDAIPKTGTNINTKNKIIDLITITKISLFS